MEPRMRILGVVLVVALLAVTVGCGWLQRTPMPTSTPPDGILAEILAARDAALAYVRRGYGDKAPPDGIAWIGHSTTPEGLVGGSSYEFVADDWVMTVLVAIVSPNSTVYVAGLGNDVTGCFWKGTLNASYAILESNLGVAAEVLAVRDAVLFHVRRNYPDSAPAENVVWVGERTTPEGAVGHESCRFAADDWVVTIEYDLVLPTSGVYRIELSNPSTEFLWRGDMDREGAILEHR